MQANPTQLSTRKDVLTSGPLLWHFENAPASHKGELSLELSLDEVQALARTVGFEFVEQRMVRSTYTGTPDSMLEHVYNCAFWVARKVAPTPTAAKAGTTASAPAAEASLEDTE